MLKHCGRWPIGLAMGIPFGGLLAFGLAMLWLSPEGPRVTTAPTYDIGVIAQRLANENDLLRQRLTTVELRLAAVQLWAEAVDKASKARPVASSVPPSAPSVVLAPLSTKPITDFAAEDRLQRLEKCQRQMGEALSSGADRFALSGILAC